MSSLTLSTWYYRPESKQFPQGHAVSLFSDSTTQHFIALWIAFIHGVMKAGEWESGNEAVMQFLGCISIKNRMGLNQFHSIVSNSVKLSSRGYTHAVCGRSQIDHTSSIILQASKINRLFNYYNTAIKNRSYGII